MPLKKTLLKLTEITSMQRLIQREGHLIVIDDGSSSAAPSADGGETRRSTENRILAVAPNYVID